MFEKTINFGFNDFKIEMFDFFKYVWTFIIILLYPFLLTKWKTQGKNLQIIKNFIATFYIGKWYHIHWYYENNNNVFRL